MKLVTSRKEYRCDACGRSIAVGERYWQKHEDQGDDISWKEHCNCAQAEHDRAPVLPPGFNSNRRLAK